MRSMLRGNTCVTFLWFGGLKLLGVEGEAGCFVMEAIGDVVVRSGKRSTFRQRVGALQDKLERVGEERAIVQGIFARLTLDDLTSMANVVGETLQWPAAARDGRKPSTTLSKRSTRRTRM